MRVRVQVCGLFMLLSGCFLTGYETHERDDSDGSIDRMDAGLTDGGGMDAQLATDAGMDADLDGALLCEIDPAACGPVTPCIDSACTCDGPVNTPFDAGPTVTPSSYDCTFTCGGQGGCRTFCRAGEDCQTLCLDAPNCRNTCLNGSSCDMTCAKNCRSDCTAGAICRYRCIGGGCTDIRCDQGAQCTMECTDPTKCFMKCDTGLKTCGDGGVMVCGTTCP